MFSRQSAMQTTTVMRIALWCAVVCVAAVTTRDVDDVAANDDDGDDLVEAYPPFRYMASHASTHAYRSRSTVSLAPPFYAVPGSADELLESEAPEYWSPPPLPLPPPGPVDSKCDALYRSVRDRVKRACANDNAKIHATLTAFNASIATLSTVHASKKPPQPRPRLSPSRAHGEAATFAELWRSCVALQAASSPNVIEASVTVAELERRLPSSTVYIEVTPYATPRSGYRSHAYMLDRYFYDDAAFASASRRYTPQRIGRDTRDCGTHPTELSAAERAVYLAFLSRVHLASLAKL